MVRAAKMACDVSSILSETWEDGDGDRSDNGFELSFSRQEIWI